jgi:hypothetical protein
MRFSILVMSVYLSLIPSGRAQESVEVETSLVKTAELPLMPRPTQSSRIAGWPGPQAPNRPLGANWNFRPIPKHRLAESQFWIVTGSTMGTSLLLIAATSHCRHTVDVNSCFGQAGDFKPIQGIQIGLSAILATVGYGIKKIDRDTHKAHSNWWVFPVAITVFNAFEAVSQYRKHCNAGTVYDARSCK